jgi:hypothetical protein
VEFRKDRRMRAKPNHVIFVLCVLSLTWPVQAKYGGGSGTAENPYLITTAEQMNTIGAEPNDWDKHFKLVADIDLKDFGGSSFNLIGSDSHPFKGVFDGNGRTISNLTYVITGNEELTDDAWIARFGLFRYIYDPNAVIKDLGLVNPDLRPASTCQKRVQDVGALVGTLGSGSISNCYVEGGQVQGERLVGGLAGWNSGTISDCNTTGTVGPAEERLPASGNASLDRREFFGGLVGVNRGEISSSHAIGEVSGERKVGGLVGEDFGMISNSWSGSDVSGDVDIGGLVGKNRRTSILSHCHATGHVSGRRSIGGLVGYCKPEGSIDNCYATGSVSAEEWGGGLVGLHEGTLSECYATAFVFIDADNAGGLVGRNGGTIHMSCAHGHVSGKKYIGGLVGFNSKQDILNNDPVVTDSYARCSVHGEDSVGGLIGFSQGDTVLRCYSTGKVTGATEDSWIGGLVGENSGIPVENSFWDTVTSGLDRSEGGAGKTTTEMQNMWMYFGAGWDFAGETANGTDDGWKMCCGRSIYPKLAWEQMLVGDFVGPEGVDLADLAFLAEHWLQTVALPCDAPDLTVDARVDIEDLELMMRYWGRGAREVIFEAALDETPGFTAQGQWQFGMPAGLGGAEYGYPDPNAGYTGDNVYGVNLLQGDYPTAADGPHYLTAGPFDCRLYRDVKLQFARWLNTDEADYVRATIEFSTDGTRWAPVWEHEDTEASLTDNLWQVVVYCLGAMADRRDSLYIRWGYEVKDTEAWPMSGWNIDDIKLSGVQ